ncbi:acetate kinase [Novosphingobium sp. PC22D]|uniref:acetate/propionate family kinase n=1 Tax=Novosphingobium sp. PC22D TaxID=1962403 RepID=UPI000BF0ECE4|nr:acetate/propionate family kinase [Novosphingobium sp. PC22D]PEQ13784.1 acetate kinase [Novosphingobium sp. PC22D]
MKSILSLNAGSSSLKFAVFAADGGGSLDPRLSGKVEKIGSAPKLLIRASEEIIAEREWPDGADLTHEDLLDQVLTIIHDEPSVPDLVAVGHRVVHGGREHVAPVRVDEALMDDLAVLGELAPLHQPHNLAGIRALADLLPALPQIACFDTAFHQTMPEIACRLPLPRRFDEIGMRRYGFHGLSYEWIARRLREIDPQAAAGRVIAAHLGNGASMCGMNDGRSVDTTMGFSALDGLMMGTRCGSLDPGVVLYLVTRLGMCAEEVESMLYRDSGLLGVSGIASDMRSLDESEAPEAREAIAMFCWRATREAGALAASLGGLDALVFTAGIGENSAPVRETISDKLEYLGVAVDRAANRSGATVISAPSSAVKVFVIPTDEERMIAQHTLAAVMRQA